MKHSEHLISCEQLQQIINCEDLVILDASMSPVGGTKVEYQGWPNQVINRAQRFDIDNEFSDPFQQFPHTMLDEKTFEQKLRPFGIHQNTLVIVYDNVGLYSAPRAWWMLKAMGVTKVAVLDGGLPQWLAKGFTSNEAFYHAVEQSTVKLKLNPEYFVQTDDLLHNFNSGEAIVVDARAASRFYGLVEEPRAGVRQGHIPDSINLPFTGLLSGHVLNHIPALIERFNAINPDNKPMIFSCGSGVTACVLALGATLSGYKSISVYDGSWAEWGARVELPIQ